MPHSGGKEETMVAIYDANGNLVDFVKKEDVAEAMAKAAENK